MTNGSARLLCFLVLGLVCSQQSARAELIQGTGVVSSFGGTFHYSSSSSTSATITVSLTNNTLPILGGYLTGFAFNNPSDLITGVTLTTTDADFSLLGGPSFNNSINAFPLGLFDIGAGVSGPASGGLASGQSATFTFAVTGTGLDTLTADTFFKTKSKKRLIDLGRAEFVAGYGGYLRILPDLAVGKASPDPTPAPAEVAPVPEPSSAILMGLGLLGAGVSVYRRYSRLRREEIDRSPPQ